SAFALCRSANAAEAAQSATTVTVAGAVNPAASSETAAPRSVKRVEEVASQKGFLYYPSAPPAGRMRFSLGATYDAIDPATMYGMSFRFPQLALDFQDSLGSGFLFKAHINTMIITNEALVGVGYNWNCGGPWSVGAAVNAGVFLGKLSGFGFDALTIAGEYRPELTVGYSMGDIALSLRGSVILMGPERARVGDLWGGFDNPNLFAGHSEILYVENTTRGNSVWYFGAGAMTTRAHYAFWLLFPDSPSLYTYPRVVAGYEY
ncbi:MAG TPA: hypothetical protein VER96_25875, partial [Polyangiaceae bacterium]|nr:hypothetical protein [Polyangiaceae bacterium]